MNNENLNNELNTVEPTIAPTNTPVVPASPETPVVAQPEMVVEPTPMSAPEAPVVAQPEMVVEPTPMSVPEAPVVAQPEMVVEPTPMSVPEAPVVAQPEMVVEPTPMSVPEAPVAVQPAAPMSAPEAPAVAQPAEPMSAPEAPVVAQSVVPEALPTPPAMQPGFDTPQPAEGNLLAGEEGEVAADAKKKPSMIVIVAAVVVLLAVVGAVVYFLFFKGSGEVNKPEPNPVSEEATKLMALAGKYVDAVDALWTSDNMLCQNATNPLEMLKPSALSGVDAYGGPAFYYVFIDTKNSSEMKLDVDDSTDVAGWVRIGKNNDSYYVALSDGVNYIVDKGTDFDVPFSTLSASSVITGGNGSLYQYLNGEIFGSNTDGNGWGIGDVAILTDGDDSNDGIYMSNGKKTAGYTPFCTNVK